MLNSSEKQFTLVFTFIVLIELLTAHISSLNSLHYLAKPAIVGTLIFWVVKQKNSLSMSTRFLLLGALIGSVIGDILLMFVVEDEFFFIAGLISFLLAHLFYVVLFFKQRHMTTKPYLPLFLIYLYSLGFGYLLTQSLGDLVVPVIVYEVVIMIMASAAFFRKNAVSNLSYNLVVIGALLFLISDSILAFNKFYMPIPLSGIYIMVTYALAQYFIVFGILKSTTVTSN